MGNRIKIAIVAGITLAGLGFGLSRSGLLGGAGAADVLRATKEQAIADGQKAYRPIQVTGLDHLPDPGAVRDLLSEASVDRGGIAVSDGDADQLVSLTAEFLYHRFVNPDVAAYRQWRTSRGYRLASAEAMRGDGVDVHYRLFTGKEYPGDDSIDAVHDEMWTLGLDLRDRSHRITGLAAARIGLSINFGQLTRESPADWPLAAGEMTSDQWHGLAGGGHRRWWSSPAGSAWDIVRERGALDVASVAVVAEYERGDRYPVRLLCYKDPTDGQWWIEAFHILNYEYERFPMLEY